jgi:hypothetical protein
MRNWLGERRGNVSIILALALVPLIGLIGLGIDWSAQQSYKRRLDAAADAAALAAITTAKAYVQYNPQQPNSIAVGVAAGIAQAKKVFSVDAGSALLQTPVTPTITFPIPSGADYSATVSYSTTISTKFGWLFGMPSFQLTGQATSDLTIGQYIDFYVFVDVSASMGLPTTPQGQQLLASINKDEQGCVFACHYQQGSIRQSFDQARAAHIQLRLDTVAQALNQLFATATQTEQNSGIQNQFRIGLYPFITDAVDAAPISADFTQAKAIVTTDPLGNNLLSNYYMDRGWFVTPAPPKASNGTSIGSGGTRFENLGRDLANYVQTPLFNGQVGSGITSSSPRAYLFLITDGMEDGQLCCFTGASPQLPPTTLCSVAKSMGIKVAVLYVPYILINLMTPDTAGEDQQANAVSPSIPGTLQSCADQNLYYEASTPGDITNAVLAMFNQAVVNARLTK